MCLKCRWINCFFLLSSSGSGSDLETKWQNEIHLMYFDSLRAGDGEWVSRKKIEITQRTYRLHSICIEIDYIPSPCHRVATQPDLIFAYNVFRLFRGASSSILALIQQILIPARRGKREE